MQGIMRRIGVLGGLFDPPHWGHVLVARQAKQTQKYVDDVWIMPVYKPPWRDAAAPADNRLEMVRRAFEPEFHVDLSEFNHKKTSFTIDTVCLLKKKYPNDTFKWIIGSDGLQSLTKWHKYDELVKVMSFLVFPRAGFPTEKSVGHTHLFNEPDLIISNCSSSLVRHRIRQRLSISGIVPEAVMSYISAHHLYEQ